MDSIIKSISDYAKINPVSTGAISILSFSVIYYLYSELSWYLISPQFKNKTIFITGASSGIGEELTYQFDNLGANKIIIASRRVDELERVKSKCTNAKVEVIKLDLNNPKDCLKTCTDLFMAQPIHYLILNGGTSTRDIFEETQYEVVEKVMNINCNSNIAICMAAIRAIKEKGEMYKDSKHDKMRIFMMSSVAGIFGTPLRTIYSASKFAISGFAKALRVEAQPMGVFVGNIYPAYIKTNISKNALIGNGEKFGKTDANIAVGIDVDVACSEMLKVMYVRKSEHIVGSIKYQLIPYMSLFPWLIDYISKGILAQQLKSKEKAV